MHLSTYIHIIIALLFLPAEATSLAELQQVLKPPTDFLPAGKRLFTQWGFRACSEQQVNVLVQGLYDISTMAQVEQQASKVREYYYRRYHDTFFGDTSEDDRRLKDEYKDQLPEQVTLTNLCTHL
jgi:hypothetical protein